MVSVPCAIYRSMIRISKKNDRKVVNYLKTGLSTFNDSKSQLYDYKYIRDDNEFFVIGPYENETANMLSYTKCLIRSGKKNDYTMEKLFLVHRELPNFFLAKENLENEEKLLRLKEKQIETIKEIENLKDSEPNPKPYPTSFGTAFF